MAIKLPREFLQRIQSVSNKRARLVLDRITKSGSITTEELRDIGYDHPPRARMDAKDLGFPIRTLRVKSRDGKKSHRVSKSLVELSWRLRDDGAELGGSELERSEVRLSAVFRGVLAGFAAIEAVVLTVLAEARVISALAHAAILIASATVLFLFAANTPVSASHEGTLLPGSTRGKQDLGVRGVRK